MYFDRETIIEESIFNLPGPSPSSSKSNKEVSLGKLSSLVNKHKLEAQQKKASPLKNIGVVLKKKAERETEIEDEKMDRVANEEEQVRVDKDVKQDEENVDSKGLAALCDYGSSSSGDSE